MNYYLTGIEGMPKLLESCADPMRYFKKALYPDAFKQFYQQNLETFDAIENGYNSVIDKDQFLENMANALCEHALTKVNECRKKSEKERLQMDMNMSMAVFVLPMVLEYKGNSSKPLSDKLLAAWKKAFPKSNIQAAEFSFVEKGFHKKFCYITTAVCESFGKEDNCYELTLLRDYRDTYLAALPNGEALIKEYYDVAPSIVKHINQSGDSHEIYFAIWKQYLAPCIALIENGQMEKCRELYEKMVYDLKKEYFYLQ